MYLNLVALCLVLFEWVLRVSFGTLFYVNGRYWCLLVRVPFPAGAVWLFAAFWLLSASLALVVVVPSPLSDALLYQASYLGLIRVLHDFVPNTHLSSPASGFVSGTPKGCCSCSIKFR